MQKKVALLLLACAPQLFGNQSTQTLQAEIAKQQKTIATMQRRLDALERANQTNSNQSASFSQKDYLPDIALILNMSAVGRDVKNSEYETFGIPGFIESGDAEIPFNKDRGFNLNYAEVAMHSSVDPYFDAFAIFHLHPDEFEIEEAYVKTRSLPFGLSVEAGKFRSAFGRINQKHHHTWHFDTQPIIYKALFGVEGINDAGIQLQWVAPTDIYTLFGIEAMQGKNEQSFGDKERNNLYVGYVKSSVDLTDDLSILGGVSFAYGKTDTGESSSVAGIDLTLRDQLGSYSALIWQSEYLYRDRASEKQAGLYSELVYRYNNNYSGGVRFDAITKNIANQPNDLQKYTAMLEYKPFPMSRLRLSYSYDKTKEIAGERKKINEVMLSLNIAAGAHGAHDY